MPPSDAPERRSLLLREVARTRTPLPWAQLAVVFAIKLSIPLTTQQTSPYANELLARVLQRPSNEIGYYTGLLSVVSHIPQIASAYPWGRVSGVSNMDGCTKRDLMNV
jgi:hypothetical protein